MQIYTNNIRKHSIITRTGKVYADVLSFRTTGHHQVHNLYTLHACLYFYSSFGITRHQFTSATRTQQLIYSIHINIATHTGIQPFECHIVLINHNGSVEHKITFRNNHYSPFGRQGSNSTINGFRTIRLSIANSSECGNIAFDFSMSAITQQIIITIASREQTQTESAKQISFYFHHIYI